MSLSQERVLPLSQARDWFPGRPPAMVTMRRYVTVGLRGVILDSLLLSGRRHTSAEAIERFLAASSSAKVQEVTRA